MRERGAQPRDAKLLKIFDAVRAFYEVLLRAAGGPATPRPPFLD
jgi:hypothetical protein